MEKTLERYSKLLRGDRQSLTVKYPTVLSSSPYSTVSAFTLQQLLMTTSPHDPILNHSISILTRLLAFQLQLPSTLSNLSHVSAQ